MSVQEIVVHRSGAPKRQAPPPPRPVQTPQRVTKTITPRPGSSWPRLAKSSTSSGSSNSKDSGVVADGSCSAVADISCTVQRCASAVSTTSSIGDMCRICHCDAEEDNPLITPCRCKGSLHYVHQSCLQVWLKSKDQKHCELCMFNFKIATKTKPFKEWEKLSMTQNERRKIICSVTFHVIAITCVIWSLYVLIDRVVEEVRAGVLEWPFWTKLIVIAIGLTGGVVFMYVQCKMYSQYISRWRTYNKILIIRNALPSDLQAAAMGPAGSPGKNAEGPASSQPHGMALESVRSAVEEEAGSASPLPSGDDPATIRAGSATSPV